MPEEYRERRGRRAKKIGKGPYDCFRCGSQFWVNNDKNLRMDGDPFRCSRCGCTSWYIEGPLSEKFKDRETIRHNQRLSARSSKIRKFIREEGIELVNRLRPFLETVLAAPPEDIARVSDEMNWSSSRLDPSVWKPNAIPAMPEIAAPLEISVGPVPMPPRADLDGLNTMEMPEEVNLGSAQR